MQCVASQEGENIHVPTLPPTPPNPEMLRTIAVNGEVVVTVAETTAIVVEAIQRQQTAPTASAALGRCLTSALLLSSFRGEGEQIQITFNGSGPLGTMNVISNFEGHVRGYVCNPGAEVPLREDGQLDVGSGVGRSGTLSVVRSMPGLPPYTGTVAITTGEVAEDIATYIRDSEQVATALGVGVAVGGPVPGTLCSAAGGFLVQVLPLVSPETLDNLEHNMQTLPPMSTLLQQGVSLAQITDMLLEGIGASPGAQTMTPLYGPCETELLRPRMLRAISAIPPPEINEILEESGHIEVKCEFCQEAVQFEREDLKQLLLD